MEVAKRITAVMGSFRWLSVSGYVHHGVSFDGLHGPPGAICTQDDVDDDTYGWKVPAGSESV